LTLGICARRAACWTEPAGGRGLGERLTARFPVHLFQNGDFRCCGTLEERPACEIEEDPGGASRLGGEKMLQQNTIAQFPDRLAGRWYHRTINPTPAPEVGAAEIG
jgi:hypothetical protein